MTDRLAGRNVLVTGATRGVGSCFVTSALERGAAAVYAGHRSTASLPEQDERVVPFTLDITSQEQVDAAAEQFPEVDLLVLNAGVTCLMTVVAAPDEQAFRDTMEVNFFGNLHMIRAFAPALRRRRGGIVVVLSVAALALSRSAPLYSASKAAALMMALGVREELRDDGVTLTVSMPGFIATEMSAKMASPKASPRQIADRSLDGWSDGVGMVWPDRFAELVGETIGAPMQRLVDEPRAVMTELITAFATDPLAGY